MSNAMSYCTASALSQSQPFSLFVGLYINKKKKQVKVLKKWKKKKNIAHISIPFEVKLITTHTSKKNQLL